MSNEKFKVKFGLAVGDTAATIDGTTGAITSIGDASVSDIILNGGDIKSTGGTTAITVSGNSADIAGDLTVGDDLTVNGNDIVTTQTAFNLINTTATALNIGGAATTVSIGANTGTTTINNDLVADNFDTANLRATGYITAGYGGAAPTTLAANGDVTVGLDITINGNTIKSNGGNNAIQLNVNDVQVLGDLTVGGNTIFSSTSNAIELSGSNVEVVGDLTVTGNDIKSNGGTTAITMSSADVAVAGDLTVTGNDIKSSSATAIIMSGSNVEVVGDLTVTGNDIKSSGGTTAITMSSADVTVAGDLTVTGNDIKSSAGTAAITLSGIDVAVNGDLDVKGANISNSTGALVLTSTGATNIELTPGSGTTVNNGNMILGPANTNTLLTTNGTGDLTIHTNGGTNSGTFVITAGANGNITVTPNGTGNFAIVPSNGGNLTNARNYVYGGIRNATTDSIGDIWALNSTGPVVPVRGISLDNSVDTTKTAGLVLRQGSATSTAPARLIFERSRGTVGSPTAIQAGDLIGIINGTGYTSTGWLNDNISPTAPVTLSMTATETWVSNTNLGTGIALSLAPTATTITSTANLIAAINHNPQSATYRSDAFTFRQGKTGTTDLLTLGTTSSTLSSNTINIFASGVTATPYKSTISPSTGAANGEIMLGTASSDGSKKSSFGFQSVRYNGTTLSATQSGDVLGEYKFNGNTATSGSSPSVPGAPGANIVAAATENWSSTANGTKFTFSAIKNTTLNSIAVIDAGPTSATFKSDSFTFQDSNSVEIIGDNINYNRVYGQWQYDTTVTPAASNTAYAFPIASGVVDFANIASVGSTSRIIPGAAGMYKLQFSVQVQNDDSASEHIAYFWWRKNGTDVPGSMGQVGVVKATGSANGLTIAGWDNMISSANTTDYWELMYAVDDANHVDFPAFGTTAFGPSTAALFITLVPVGA